MIGPGDGEAPWELVDSGRLKPELQRALDPLLAEQARHGSGIKPSGEPAARHWREPAFPQAEIPVGGPRLRAVIYALAPGPVGFEQELEPAIAKPDPAIVDTPLRVFDGNLVNLPPVGHRSKRAHGPAGR